MCELRSRIGGLWVLNNDNGLSAACDSLHVNSENKVTAYKDFLFPDSARIYPDHVQMAQYPEAYADRFGLRSHIRFRSRVTAGEPLPGLRWTVLLADGTRTRFDAVVGASGH